MILVAAFLLGCVVGALALIVFAALEMDAPRTPPRTFERRANRP